MSKPDLISTPEHYRAGSGYEVGDVIEAWGLNFARGNIVKYVARAGIKPGADELDDLRKAREYIDREIRRVGRARRKSAARAVKPVVYPARRCWWRRLFS